MAGNIRICHGGRHNKTGMVPCPFGRLNLLELWRNACKELRQSIGEDDFRNWISKASLSSIERGVAEIKVPTQFTGEWILQTYGDKILECLRGQSQMVLRLDYVVSEKPAGENIDAVRPIIPDTGGGELYGSNLIKRFTFDQFVVANPNTVAYAAAKRVSEDEKVNFSPLFLYGGVGLGKTHLMNAVGLMLRESNPNVKVIYLSAEQFMYLFVRALQSKSVIGFKEIFRSVDVLLVDDIQFIAGKNSTQEEFFHTFNALAEQNKRIILTADRSPGKIEGLEARIRSRLQSGLAIELHPADYELRLGILQKKVELHKVNNPNLCFDSGVLEFLARRIVSNARILEGALNRLVAAQSFMPSDITMEYTLHVLADLLRDNDRKISLNDIIKCVTKHYNLKVSDLTGTRRTKHIVQPRQVAIHLAKNLTTRSLPDIGRAFNRDHTTVLHSVRRMDKLIKCDAEIANDYELLWQRLSEFG